MSYRHTSNQSADWTENLVRLDIISRGWVVLTGSSRDTPYDLVVHLGLRDFQTVQVKKLQGFHLRTTNRSPGGTVSEHGKAREIYHYRDFAIDWLVGVDTKSQRLYYYQFNTYSRFDNINVRSIPTDAFPFNAVASNAIATSRFHAGPSLPI